MQSDHPMTWRPIQAKPVGLLVVVLSLASTGPPDCHAQMEFNGGYVQTHRDDHGEVPSLTARPRVAVPPIVTSISYFPDRDFYYSSYYSAITPAALADYNRERVSERADLSTTSPARLPINVPASALPWNQVGFKDYDSSRSHSLVAARVPPPASTQRPQSAGLIAHLPDHAIFWVEGSRTRSTGRTRCFQSPPLLTGRTYNYRVRAAWIENGQWVSRSRTIVVQAGTVQAIYLRLDE